MFIHKIWYVFISLKPLSSYLHPILCPRILDNRNIKVSLSSSVSKLFLVMDSLRGGVESRGRDWHTLGKGRQTDSDEVRYLWSPWSTWKHVLVSSLFRTLSFMQLSFWGCGKYSLPPFRLGFITASILLTSSTYSSSASWPESFKFS